jgi:cell division septum initiation protein DivIVA
MKMTRDLLSALGSCGGYVETFDRLFPADEHPDGVEVTAEVCVQYADEFDWAWAADVMLTQEAHSVWSDAVYYSGRTARAQKFGELMADPDNHNVKIEKVQERADRNATDREREAIRALEEKIAEGRQLVESLPALEAQLTTLGKQYKANEAARLRRHVQRAEYKVTAARAAYDKLEAELAALVGTQTETDAPLVDADAK